MLYDSHIHLTDTEYDNFLPSILVTLKGMSIKACSVAVNNSTSSKALRLFGGKDIHNIVYNFLGIHPQYADENISQFEEMVGSNIHNIDGIGEIGLDPTYYNQDKNTKAMQDQVFTKMLTIAETYDKPISVHSRQSLDEILNVLSSYNLKKTCLHWFDGSPQQLEKSLDMGLYVSFGPSLIYSKKKQGLLKLTDQRKLLIETDGPVRYPSCFKNVITLPTSVLMSVVRSMSEVLCLSPKNLAEKVERNSILFFE
ncbi:MAG TPA: TatD family hydrolase [Nitrososphaeraceae archaeon]|nr:TatD family hydrolase [Nitrososphaeraceae archaeon]